MQNYADHSVTELRQLLRRRGLVVSGLKSELIGRLLADDIQQSVCCTNCHKPVRNMHISTTGVSCCFPCLPWYRLFARSVRRTLAALDAWGYHQVDDIREQAAQLYQESELSRDLGYDGETGIPHHGPADDRHWSRLLQQMTPWRPNRNPFIHGYSIDKLDNDTVAEILRPLENLGVNVFPERPLLREHLAHFLVGTFGQKRKDRLVSIMLQWSTPEYFFRKPKAWALSFSFVQEVVSELGDRAHFSDAGIRIIGSSNNLYEITPIHRLPFYRVTRIHEEQRGHICIDPIGAASVVFGDVLVSLVLSLFEDQKSALRINTLHPHIFGMPRRHRNRNINHLWQRALGRRFNERRGEQEAPEDNIWQYLLERFQTNLDDWPGAEEEGA